MQARKGVPRANQIDGNALKTKLLKPGSDAIQTDVVTR